MKPSAIAAALALAAALPGLALAQPAPPPSDGSHAQAPASDQPEQSQAARRYSIDTKFSELMANPKAEEVVERFFHKRREAAGQPDPSPEERAHMREMVADMSPREVSQFPQANLDEAALAELDAELAQVPYTEAQPTPASTSAPAPASATN